MAHIPVYVDLKLVNSCIVHEDGTNILDINKLENIDTTGAVDGDVLSFDEATSTWVPAVASGGGTEYTAGNGVDLTGDVVSVTTACDTKWSTDTIVDISGKQDTLVSGTSIKTINGASLLGSGDLVISGGVGTDASGIAVASITNLTATDVQAALAELQLSIDAINTQLAGINTALQNINS